MRGMTHRERYVAVLEHRQPDRVPVDLMGTAGGLTDRALFELRSHLGLGDEPRRFRHGENVNYYDEEVLQALDVDARRVWMRPPARALRAESDGTVSDEWGLRHRQVGGLMQRVDPPLAGAGVEDLRNYPWPDPRDPARVAGLADEAARLHNETDYAVVARAPVAGFLDLASWLRGMEQFMLDLALDPSFAMALIERIRDVEMGFYEVYLQAVGPYVQMVETMDDYAGNAGPLISPGAFREFIAPARRELNQLIKGLAPRAAIFLHTDGELLKLADDLIACGVEVLNPVQPLPGSPHLQLKARYGDRLSFHGGIDTIQALRGTPGQVEDAVRRCIAELGVGGGYILAPCNHIQADVPPENTVRLFQAAHAYGVYA